MVDVGKMLKRASSADEAAEQFKKARAKKRKEEAERRRSKAAQKLARNIAWLGAIAVAAGIAFGWINTTVSPLVGAIVFAAGIGISYALGENDDELSITFALSAAAIGMLLVEFVLPSWMVAPIAAWLPVEVISGFSAVEFAVLATFVILAWWFIDIRFISRSGVKAETVAKRMRKRAEKLIEEWFSITRVAIMLGIGIGFIILNQFAEITGEFAGMAAEAPYLAADLATIILGYLALGGDVPIFNGIPFVSEIGAIGWVALTGLFLALAVGVEYAD